MKRRTGLPRRQRQPIAGRRQALRQDIDEPYRSEDKVDESLKETFPASDPPSWTVLTGVGARKACTSKACK
jgi:hypothetical protein